MMGDMTVSEEQPEGRDGHGRLVVWLAADHDKTTLRRAGDIITDLLQGEPLDRFHAADQKFWDYRVRGQPVTLHWSSSGALSLVGGAASREVDATVLDVRDRILQTLAREDALRSKAPGGQD